MENTVNKVSIKVSVDYTKIDALAKELFDTIEKAKALTRALADECENLNVTLE